MRILMMGTGPFAVPTFRALLASEHQVLGLVTRPVPPPSSRNRGPSPPNPMREVAEAANLRVEAPDSINEPDVHRWLTDWQADLHVVCDYGQILSTAALQTARWGGINLHASLLPRYRGAAPINWAIYRGETETGVSVIHMTPRLDAGPCLVQRTTPIGAEEDAVELEHRLSEIGVDAVLEAIQLLEAHGGSVSMGIVQDEQLRTSARRLRKQDAQVDWSRSAEQLHRQVRAFKPWPGSFTEWQRAKGPLRLLLDQVRIAADVDRPATAPPGEVLSADATGIVVVCGVGALRIERLQPAGKNVLTAEQFLRGYPLQAGERLGTNMEC
ncbi:MAG: methionyl-tRNA formyltransferase [Planctomycetales bacterium]|nr:methionyl-tRNA formyltransferase [Planctomycetales bacterium]